MDDDQGVHVEVEWVVSDELEPTYANNIVVQHTDSEFIIAFFQTFPPIVIGTPEERLEQLRQIDSIKANCVARIVVPLEKMEEFTKVMQLNLNRFQQRQGDES